MAWLGALGTVGALSIFDEQEIDKDAPVGWKEKSKVQSVQQLTECSLWEAGFAAHPSLAALSAMNPVTGGCRVSYQLWLPQEAG